MLGQDAFDWFETHGGLTRANGQRFRDMVLSRGNTLDLAQMYRVVRRPRSADRALSRILRAPDDAGRCRAAAAPALLPPAPAPAVAPAKGERGR